MKLKVADLLTGRDNNFNLIRFLAAASVIYSHSFTVIQGDGHNWLFTGIKTESIGSLAVNVFFILSGFLVAKSWLDKPDLLRFFVARALRIFPALIVLSLITVFIIGPVASLCLPGSYFTDLHTWLYVPLTATLIDDSAKLPGVFESLTEKGLINAPLWTLKYEALSYTLLAIFGGLALLATKARGIATLASLGVIYLGVQFLSDWREQHAILDNLMRFWLCFFLGTGLYLLRDTIRMSARTGLLLALVAALSYGTALFDLTSKIALAYGVMWFALVPKGSIRNFNRIGDYSYGLYIFAWPLQQIAAQAVPGLTPHIHFVITFPVVLLLAVASWHLLEKPSLSRRKATCSALDNFLGRSINNGRIRLAWRGGQ